MGFCNVRPPAIGDKAEVNNQLRCCRTRSNEVTLDAHSTRITQLIIFPAIPTPGRLLFGTERVIQHPPNIGRPSA